MAKSTDIPASAREAVRERDRTACRGCGRAGYGSEVHHIVYRSQERNNHAVENLVSLCYRCHRMAHSHPSWCRPALQAVVRGEALTMLAYIRRVLAREGRSRVEVAAVLRSLSHGTL